MEISGKKILVTGGAGFVGSHLVNRLLEMGCFVFVIDDLTNGRKTNLTSAQKNKHFVFIKGTVENEDLVNRLVVNEKCQIVFHLAATNLLRSIKYPKQDLMVNTLGTMNLLLAMQKSKAYPFMVFSSTGSVYGEPKYQPQDEVHSLEPVSPYGISKLAAEKYVLLWHKLYKIKTIALRYYNVYGPRQSFGKNGGVVNIFIKQALNKESLTIESDGNQERCFTYVADVVTANILAASKENAWGSVYNIGTTEITTINNLAKLISRLCQTEFSAIYLPRRLGDIDKFRPDLTKAKKLLGYQPKYKLVDGLNETINWFKQVQ